MKRKYWVTTDTHFGHDALMRLCGRPRGFSEKILNGFSVVKESDVFIHLGDICIGHDGDWHRKISAALPRGAKRWLVRGNHDRKSTGWYLSHGWDVVCEYLAMNIFGSNVVLSHKPVADHGFDINIHGHFHNSDRSRHEECLSAISGDKHRLLFLEHDYVLFDLRKIVERQRVK